MDLMSMYHAKGVTLVKQSVTQIASYQKFRMHFMRIA